MIETEDLSKRFDDFWAVDGVSLRVREGQVLALLGQNGAGKTTTVRMLTALLTPTRGRATVAGYDVVSQPNQVRAVVGVLTEQHGLYVRMTAEEYLDFFGQVYRLDPSRRRRRSRELLEYFGLEEVARQRIGEYSKGMRQKLALARALIHEPPVLLLDEPTSAMDPESARLVRDQIAKLRSARRAIIICTHNLSEAEALADIIAIIYRGRILVTGTLDELRRRVLGAPEYEALLSAPWRLDGFPLPQGVALSSQEGTRLRFRVKDPAKANPALLQALLAHGAPVVTFREVTRSLEQVYLAVMAQVRKRL
ncbi:MAG: ABC transporter ATP-binding protein [Anaerolineae bacterium]|nr:MAG: ABC transporter ATP-binding protein [Anaerolineae bacterium]